MTTDVRDMTPEQIQTLLERLNEAEETLAAIRNGEVDGLVVNGPQGDQVFTLKGSDHPYRVMIDAMEEGAVTLGTDGTILFCNRRFAAMLRLSHEQVLGVPFARFLDAEDQMRFAGLVKACRLDGVRGEVLLQAGDGTPVPVSLACSALPAGDVESLSLVATDLTARHAAEATIRRQNDELERRVLARTAELAQANAALRAEIDERKLADARIAFQVQVLDNVAQAVVATDLAMTVQYWNHAAKQLYGWSSAEAVGRNAFELISPQASYEQGQAIMAALRLGQSWRGEYLVQDRYGRIFPVDAADSPFFAQDGTLIGIIGVSSDITERKRAEEALRESQNQFAALIHNVESGVALIDAHGQFTIVNPKFLRLFGLEDTPDNILNINSRDWSAWQVFDEIGELLHVDAHPVRKAVLTSRSVRNQLVGMRLPAGGDLVWMLISAEPMLKADGSLDRVICTYHDITARKQAEVALRESEARYRNLFAVIPSGVAVYEVVNDGNDLDGKDFIFQDMNPAGEKIDQVQRAEIIGKSLYQCFPNVREMGLVAVLQRVWQTGAPEFFPVTLYTDNNISLWLTNYVWRLPSGELVALFDDITELKRAEEALRESERRERERAEELAVLLEAVPVGVYISHDPICRHMTGNYAADEILRIPHGTELSLTVPEGSRPVHFRTLKDGRELRLDELPAQRSARGEQITNFEFTLAFDDGMLRHVLGYGTPLLDEQGGPRGSVAVLVDITERTQAQEAQLASLREKEAMLKEIHHRVKNNLQVISSLVSLQADTIDNPTLRPLFNDLRDRVRTMALVHEKLYQSESLAKVDFAEYTQSLLDYLWRAHGEAAAAVRLTPDLQPVMLTIEKAVPCGLMLNELVTNALKHAFRDRAGGELVVALHADEAGTVRLSVSDNGAGLPADWRQATSLGLQLVQMLSKQVRGTLEVSTDGGTTFALVFDSGGKR